MIHRFLAIFCHAQVVLAVLVFSVLTSERSAERYGDSIQIALPLVAFGCALSGGGGGEFFLRFLALEAAIHIPKQTLGDAPINTRPSGGGEGFPSGHTAAAAFGASALVQDCIKGAPAVKAAVIISAAYVGASRIDAGKHTIWQVLAGGIVGWGVERSLRTPGVVRTRVLFALRSLGRRLRAAVGLTQRPLPEFEA